MSVTIVAFASSGMTWDKRVTVRPSPELVMEATVLLVSGGGLTTLMVTHNMEHALAYSSRIVMMDDGRIVADIDARQKATMSVADLVERFRVRDDRIVLHRAGRA